MSPFKDYPEDGGGRFPETTQDHVKKTVDPNIEQLCVLYIFDVHIKFCKFQPVGFNLS